MKNGKTLAMMLIVSGGLAAAVGAPTAAFANCGAYSGPAPSSSFGANQSETPEQRAARLEEQRAYRAARKEARLAKKAAKAQAAAEKQAAAQAAAVASN
jgi:hypothetical protein